jgi:hypothetical protein
MCRGRRARILLHLHIQLDAGGREAGTHSTTPTYTVRRDSPAREPSWSAFWLQKPSILRACVREDDAGGREAGAPLDLKMPLEARRPPLPTADVCPPGRCRRRRLAITANSLEWGDARLGRVLSVVVYY